ncbi:hypothetical protein HHK36_016812 [Tetracentron sinense]|uniref:Retrovirus-related Pol polyprotein from transposon TNT 1-94-like beta-barrel domain-containing protein n=1 Tax=Tetracentron sinense TaxID=13715 RepID=A0A834Z154_TETSI|nr:hypothetical protein HHK36_016812 [Tetracentron sinense]
MRICSLRTSMDSGHAAVSISDLSSLPRTSHYAIHGVKKQRLIRVLPPRFSRSRPLIQCSVRFRPCIDIHKGKVKQIVGSTLRDSKEGSTLITNFESDKPAAEFANLYKEDGLLGGHVIMLGADPSSKSAAIEALHAHPGGGGGTSSGGSGSNKVSVDKGMSPISYLNLLSSSMRDSARKEKRPSAGELGKLMSQVDGDQEIVIRAESGQGSKSHIVGNPLPELGPPNKFPVGSSPIQSQGLVLLLQMHQEDVSNWIFPLLNLLRGLVGGLQVGGGINSDNALDYIEEGASHVIVTSYVFNNGQMDLERLKDLVRVIGKQRLVLDLSCRKKEGKYAVVTDRWQKFSDVYLNEKTLDFLAINADEFLVHGVDVEGKSQNLMGYVDGSLQPPTQFLANSDGNNLNETNPLYDWWNQTDQLLLSWINATLSEENLCDNLATIGHSESDEDKNFWVLNGLGSEYEAFVTSILAKPPIPSYDHLIPNVINQEIRTKENHPVDTAFVAHYNNNHNKRHNENKYRSNNHKNGCSLTTNLPLTTAGILGPSPLKCQVCGKLGHGSLDCWHRFNQTYSKSEQPSTPHSHALAALSISDPSDPQWYPNTGASSHMTNNSGIFTIIQPYIGHNKVIVGNGSPLSITHIGTIYLSTPYGSLLLQDVLLVGNRRRTCGIAWQALSIPVTYAGGVTIMVDLERIKVAGMGRVDVTVGSALDIFGGNLAYKDVVAWHAEQEALTVK